MYEQQKLMEGNGLIAGSISLYQKALANPNKQRLSQILKPNKPTRFAQSKSQTHGSPALGSHHL
jgi:hypothetical protein